MYDSYKIEDDCQSKIDSYRHLHPAVISPFGKQIKSYSPIEHKELPSEIAKLRTGNKENILQFVSTYGRLGFAYNVYDGGDPIPWIIANAHTIYFCLALIKGLNEPLVKAEFKQVMKDFLNRLESDPTIQDWLPYLVFSDSYWIKKENWIKCLKRDESTRRLALFVLHEIININIRHIRPQISVCWDRSLSSPEELSSLFKMFLSYSSLIEIAYWHLATSISHGRVNQCKECGEYFIQEDPRQRYCPPKGYSKESACAIRTRVRTFLTNRKVKVKGGSSHGKTKRKE